VRTARTLDGVGGRPLAAIVALGVLALAGCSGDEPSPTTSPSSASASGTDSTTRYVALGDSYTAAPGVPTTDPQDPCAQSDHNYPHLLAQELGYALDDVSCSGADTTSLTGEQQVRGGTARPPQLDAVTQDTQVVTLGIGGNDFSLFGTIVGTCLGVASQDPQGAPCRDQLDVGGEDQLAQHIDQVGDRVRGVLETIMQRATDARVFVIGYPQPVPAQSQCTLLPLAVGDYAYARQSVEELDDALRSAAEATGATYVDLLGPSEGHDICAGDDAWVNGLVTDVDRAIAFHPFEVEQQAVAALVKDQLQG
jgi:lysophospholipase L1-like esterase